MSAAEATETDYLVVGAGAMGLAFADELATAMPEGRITLVDRRAKPGGHWNDAYPFVRLHQPAVAYGVNSAPLGTGGADLSSRAEILAYFERALERLAHNGRVEFLPMSEYEGEGRVTSVVDHSASRRFNVRRRTVDATYMNVQVPATHPPRYEVDPEANLVPPNELVRISRPWRRYVVIGAGKTGADAVNFLLASGVDPGAVQWVVSNDMWFWNRAVVQPRTVAAELVSQLEAVRAGSSVEEIFDRLERQGSVFRIDPAVTPVKWRCATVNEDEIRALRTVTDVVRAGRVVRVGAGEIELEQGSLPNGTDQLVIDCSANGLAARPPRPLFGPGRITLQSLMMCQQVFSAAIAAHLEASDLDDAERNASWQVIPHPEFTSDLPGAIVASFRNLLNGVRRMPVWMLRSRLNMTSHDASHRVLRQTLRARLIYPQARRSARTLLGGDV